MTVVTDRNDPRLGHGADEQPVKQSDAYLVLPEHERKAGFIRPYRDSYKHVGPPGPRHTLRDLTPEEAERYKHCGYVKFEPYGPDREPCTGRYWKQPELDKVGVGCGEITRMDRAIAETYAREPGFYGNTYCIGCSKHLPVNEFVWVPGGGAVGS